MKKKEKTFSVINPNNSKLISTLPIHQKQQVEEKILLAQEAFKIWSSKTITSRSKEIIQFRKFLAKNKDEMISIICEETGKTKMDAMMEVFTVCESINYIVSKGKLVLKNSKRSSGLLFYKNSYIKYHPYGVVGIISPWNYPLILSVTPIINALISGNTVVIKPSELTPFTTLKVLDFFHRAGLQDGILQVATGLKETGEALVSSLNTKMIFFTGSTNVGKQIAIKCAENLKPVILELGGKDPMIVFKDADLLRAARAAIWGGFFNSGQTCISIERVYVEKSAQSEFIHLLKEEYERMIKSNSNDFPSNGKMTSKKQIEILENHLVDAKNKKAYFVKGGFIQPGFYQVPSIIISTNHKMKIMNEETFGPEISIMEFKTIEEAKRLANDSEYGLSASVWSKDISKAKKFAEGLECGSVSINDSLSHYMISDLPFGGFKKSGLGRVHGKEGILSFVQSQSISYNKFFWKFSDELWWYPYSKKIYGYFSRAIRFLFG